MADSDRTLFIAFTIKNVPWYTFHCFYNQKCTIFLPLAPRVLSPFRGGGIAYLSDPDRYAGWSFYTPVRATQARQIEG